jgi:hypothetical protein
MSFLPKVAFLLENSITRKFVEGKLPSRHTPKRLGEPICILTISLVEPESLLVLEPPSTLQANFPSR